MSVRLYRCTAPNLKIENYTILNKSQKFHPIKQQLYGPFSYIWETIQVRWARQAEHCRKSRDKLIREVLLWAHQCWSTSKDIHQLYAGPEYRLKDLPREMLYMAREKILKSVLLNNLMISTHLTLKLFCFSFSDEELYANLCQLSFPSVIVILSFQPLSFYICLISTIVPLVLLHLSIAE